jgi:hypothetical protein
MTDKSKSTRSQATKASAQFRAFRPRVSMAQLDRNRWPRRKVDQVARTSRGVGPYQEHILAVLADHGRPMTEREIVTRLTLTNEQPSRDYHSNLSRALIGLADRGLIGLEPGHWTGPLAQRTWVPTLCQATEAGHKMTSVLRAWALIEDG